MVDAEESELQVRYLSVCSGIEAATVAWKPLGWFAAGFAEIEPFPSAVLKHHYPDVKNHGDFTKIRVSDVGQVGILIGEHHVKDFPLRDCVADYLMTEVILHLHS